MWALARIDLGLSDIEFWRMTPRKFFALVDRVEANRMRQDYGAAQIAAILCQIHGDPKKSGRAISPIDFMPFAKKSVQKQKRMTAEETASVFKNIFAPMVGGTVKHGR